MDWGGACLGIQRDGVPESESGKLSLDVWHHHPGVGSWSVPLCPATHRSPVEAIPLPQKVGNHLEPAGPAFCLVVQEIGDE